MPKLSSVSDNPSLHTFLNRHDVQAAGLTAAYLDGFVTAAAAGPPWDRIQDFMDLLFGEDMPAFDGDDEAEGVISALLARHNELAELFDETPTKFQPAFTADEVEDWATGFGRGMGLAMDAWETAMTDQETAMLAMPVLYFARAETSGRPMIEEIEDVTPEAKAELIGQIHKGVALLADHFRKVEAATSSEDILQAFLARSDVQAAGISLSYIDGLVAAAAAGPAAWESIDDLRGCLLGDNGPSFQSDEEKRGVFEAIVARYTHCGWLLDEDPASYEPIFAPDGDVTAWASGFARGMMLAPKEWEAVLNDPDQGTLLAPILPFARDPGSGRTILEESGEASLEDYAYLSRHIRDAVVAINDYWWGVDGDEELPMPGEAGAPPPQPPPANTNQPRRHKKVGRNEPCPCGSGRKYKKCCGAH